MKKIYLYSWKLIALITVLATDFNAFTQPPGGAPPGGQVPTGIGPPCWDPECIPIDGGIGFLIAAGAVLGVKKIRDHKKTV